MNFPNTASLSLQVQFRFLKPYQLIDVTRRSCLWEVSFSCLVVFVFCFFLHISFVTDLQHLWNWWREYIAVYVYTEAVRWHGFVIIAHSIVLFHYREIWYFIINYESTAVLTTSKTYKTKLNLPYSNESNPVMHQQSYIISFIIIKSLQDCFLKIPPFPFNSYKASSLNPYSPLF